MKIRLPRIYYILRHKFWSFAARNWRGCEYCNEEVLVKLLGVDVDGLDVRLTTPLIENTDEICAWGDIPPSRIKVIKEK